MYQASREGPSWGRKVLAAGVLVAAGLLASSPAHAVTTFTVNSAGDGADANSSLNGFCDADPDPAVTKCTLRAAIEEANDTPGADVINFDIPSNGGFQTISPDHPLEVIREQVTIDGYTQPGAETNNLAKGNDAVLKIELNGSAAGSAGLAINTSNSVVKGLAINRFAHGILVASGTTGNRIEGNFIGTDPSGTQDLGNSSGVSIQDGASNTMVGGNTLAARNLISGNDGAGIGIGSSATKVLGNFIGTTKDGTGNLGNSSGGVAIVGGSNNVVGDSSSGGANTIAFNSGDGVAINAPGSVAKSNRVLRNSIFSNGELAIDLGFDGSTRNDPDDPATPQPDPDKDTGPNNLQNKPVLTSAKTSPTNTTVAGKLNSTPNKAFTVRFFSNPPGGDEGKRFIGQKMVSTDASGNVSFTKTLPKVAVGQTVTATATASGGNTSEFSAPRKVVAS